MLQRDYIMRLIEEYGRVLAQIMNFRKEGRPARALELVRENFSQISAEAKDELKGMSPVQAQLYLEKDLKLNRDQMEVVANLLKEQGDIYTDLELPEDAELSYSQSLKVFERIKEMREDVFSLDVENKINYLRSRLGKTKG